MGKVTERRNDVVADLKHLFEQLPKHKRKAVIKALREAVSEVVPPCPVEQTAVGLEELSCS